MTNTKTISLVKASFTREELPLKVRDAAVYLG